MSVDMKKLDFQIDAASFTPVSKEERTQLETLRESTTYWKDAWKRLRKNKIAMGSLVVIILLALVAIIGPMLSPYTYSMQIRGQERLGPSLQHWMGTDYLGRDMFVRVLYGTRISLSIGLVASVMVLIIGSTYGAISGYFGGLTDNLMMRFVEILYSIPDVLIVILLTVVLKDPLEKAFEGREWLNGLSAVGPGLISIFLVLSALYWVNMARIVRGQVLSIKGNEYITAAIALGASKRRIIFRHLIPNCLGPILVTVTLQIPSAIFTEAFLSFIGLGVSVPMASLGSLTSGAIGSIYSYTYLLIFPALTISIIILAFNLLGDGLRDALDPRMKK